MCHSAPLCVKVIKFTVCAAQKDQDQHPDPFHAAFTFIYFNIYLSPTQVTSEPLTGLLQCWCAVKPFVWTFSMFSCQLSFALLVICDLNCRVHTNINKQFVGFNKIKLHLRIYCVQGGAVIIMVPSQQEGSSQSCVYCTVASFHSVKEPCDRSVTCPESVVLWPLNAELEHKVN